MKTAVIIDCILAALLLGFLIYGAWRGLFRSVVGLVIVVLALTGATFAARELTPMAVDLLRPVIESAISKRVDDAMSGGASSQAEDVAPVQPELPTKSTGGGSSAAGSGGEDSSLLRIQAGELLRLMGWDDTLTKSLSDKAAEKVRETGVSLAMAVADSVTESFVYMLIFALSFVALLLLLHLVAKALDVATKLPGIHFLNGLGGALIGLLQGALLIFLVVWLLRSTRVSFDAETVNQTYLLRFFVSNGPLDLLFY
ncbi:CvpA family protein [Oscillibacter sp.]|uniref:CvpA family protein n=1 Tax=Oscillibacter sp. TaxID=1945593 RepID=UPI0028A2CFEE|nr:CvpA family protein [Oscillibacter sp.]